MSDTLRPHGPQPTRLLCPWDFPGKSTGVAWHRLLQVVTQPASNWFKQTEFVDSPTETIRGYLCFQDSWAYRPKPCRQDRVTYLQLWLCSQALSIKRQLPPKAQASAGRDLFCFSTSLSVADCVSLALAGLSAILGWSTMDRGRQCSELPGLYLVCTPDPSVYTAGMKGLSIDIRIRLPAGREVDSTCLNRNVHYGLEGWFPFHPSCTN